MISVAFINNENEVLIASDPFILFENTIDELNADIASALLDFQNTHDQYMIESEILGEISEEKNLYLESEGKNIFDKIGNAILTIFKKLKDFIDGILDKIKNIGFKNKTNEEKMKALLDYYKKNEPEKYNDIKDEVIVAFNKGELNPMDLNSLKEVMDAYDEIVKLSKQKDIDSKTLRGKFEQMKRKCDKIEESRIVKVSKAAKIVIPAITAIVAFKSEILKSKKQTMEAKDLISKKNEDVVKAIETLKNIEDGKYVSDNLSKAQILQNANAYLNREFGKMISEDQGRIKKFEKGIFSFISKYEKKKREKFDKDQTLASKFLSQEEDRARNKEREKNYEDSYDKATGQRVANDDAMYINSHVDAEYKKAKVQAQGREDGTTKKNPPKTTKIEIVDSKGNNIRQGKKQIKNKP